MRDLEVKRKSIYLKLVLATLLIIVALSIKAMWGSYQKYSESKATIDNLRAQYEKAESEKERLGSEIARLETKEGVEAEIRGKFSVVKPGEEVLVIVDDGKATETAETEEEKNVWQKFWSGVVDLFNW